MRGLETLLLLGGCTDPIDGLVEPGLIGKTAEELRQHRPRIPGLADVPAGQVRSYLEPLNGNALFTSATWEFNGPRLERLRIGVASGNMNVVVSRLAKKFGKPAEYRSTSLPGEVGYRWATTTTTTTGVIVSLSSSGLEVARETASVPSEGIFSYRPIAELFALLADDRQGDWTWDEMAKHRLAVGWSRGDADLIRWCPEAKKEPDGRADEFVRRDRERKRAALEQVCRERVTREVAIGRATWVADVPILDRAEYDFANTQFLLHLTTDIKARGWGIGIFKHDSSILLLGHRVSPRICSSLGTPEADGGIIFSIENASSDVFIDDGHPGVKIRVPEKDAPATAKRIDQLKTTGLRLQVAFDLHGFGSLPVGCIGGALEGFRGRGIGYRVVDDAGALVPWTRFSER